MQLINLLEPNYENIYKEIQRAYFEQLGYQNIIIYMINNNMINNENYEFYFDNYINKIMKYEICKKIFENLLRELNPNISFKTWKILFEKDAVQLD